jgi:hypothetical protein
MRNSMRRKGGPSDGAAALGGRRRSPFAQLVPKMAEGLRANGCAHVETGIIRAALHYVVEDQPRGGGRSHRAIRVAALALRRQPVEWGALREAVRLFSRLVAGFLTSKLYDNCTMDVLVYAFWHFPPFLESVSYRI